MKTYRTLGCRVFPSAIGLVSIHCLWLPWPLTEDLVTSFLSCFFQCLSLDGLIITYLHVSFCVGFVWSLLSLEKVYIHVFHQSGKIFPGQEFYSFPPLLCWSFLHTHLVYGLHPTTMLDLVTFSSLSLSNVYWGFGCMYVCVRLYIPWNVSYIQTVVNCHVGPGNGTHILWKSSQSGQCA